MKSIEGYHHIEPKDLFWRPSNLMQIPNADYLERTGSENIGARLWRLPPKSANLDLSLIYPADPKQLRIPEVNFSAWTS